MSGLSRFVRILAVMFTAELAMDMAEGFLPMPADDFLRAVVHSLSLVLVAAPVVYFWAIKPYIRQWDLAQDALRESEEKIKAARKEAQEETEETLFNIIHDSPVAIGITDEIGRPVYWNPKFRTLGHRLSEHEEHDNIFQLMFSDPALFREFQARLKSGKQINEEEVELVSAGGARAWAEVSIQEMTFEGKKSLLMWVYDITARKSQEEAQREARIAAEQSNKAKSAFLAAMSHEIRTPLNGIIAMADMLERADLSGEHRGMAAIMKDSSAILINVINDILDYSKIESGKLELDRAGFSLMRLVEGVGDLLGVRAGEKGLRLLIFIDPETYDHFEGDPARLRQVLTNLVGNAVKFTPYGEVVVEAVAEREEDDRAFITIRVKDTGIGIASDAVGRLFQPFSQADNSTSRRFGGTGLGLSICKALVEAMGGTIGVKSKAGAGSVFWFTVPLRKRPERRTSRRGQLTGRGIVVVTDNGTFSAIVKGYMDFAGARIASVAGAEGLRNVGRRYREEGRSLDILVVDGAVSEDIVNAVVTLSSTNDDLRRCKIIAVLDRAQMLSGQYSQRTEVYADLPRPLRRNQLLSASAAAVGLESLEDALHHGRRTEDKEKRRDYVPPDRATALANGALILVAEDNPVNRNVIRMVFDRLGLAADIVQHGALALQCLEETKYGLLLTDCHMPEMDGYQLAIAIRDRERTEDRPRLPIVALTADALIGTAERCRAAGMDECLTKPVDRMELESAIEKYLPAAMALRKAKDGRESETASAAGVGNGGREAAGKAVFDKGYLREVCGGDETMIGALVGDYIQTTPPLVDQLAAALGQADFTAAREAAHALKGSSLMVGALRVSETCKCIQAAIDSGDHKGAQARRDVVLGEYEDFKKAVAQQ